MDRSKDAHSRPIQRQRGSTFPEKRLNPTSTLKSESADVTSLKRTMKGRNFSLLARSIKSDIAGTTKPMAAVNWMVTPQISKSIVKTLMVAQNSLFETPQNPHFLIQRTEVSIKEPQRLCF
jgi:hypothetical protein